MNAPKNKTEVAPFAAADADHRVDALSALYDSEADRSDLDARAGRIRVLDDERAIRLALLPDAR